MYDGFKPHADRPTLIHNDVMCTAEFAFISRVSASMLAPERRGYANSVNARSIPQDLVMFAEAVQDRFMNTLPNTGLRPFVNATRSCHAATAAELTRLPGYSSPEDAFRE